MRGVCEVTGDVDLSTLPEFIATVRAATEAADTPEVYLDCRGTTFRNIRVLHALIDASRYAVRHGRRLIIRDLSPRSAQVVRACDSHNELTIESTVVAIERAALPRGRRRR